MPKRVRSVQMLAVVVLTVVGAASARAETKCDLTFRLEGWSAFYKTGHGGGTITCGNGQRARVVINTTGGGITFGMSKILDGHGEFTPVDSIRELFGNYAAAEAHAGAGASADAQVVTKGPVSLALKGKGRGVDLGFAFGKFSIQPVRTRAKARRHVAPPPRHTYDNDNIAPRHHDNDNGIDNDNR